MTTETERKRKASNRFDEDITSLYRLELPEPKRNAYAIQVLSIESDDEQYMVDKFHEQYVAVEGRSAIAQLVDTRIGEITTNAAWVMGTTMENMQRIETVTPLGRLTKKQHSFNDQLIDQAGRYILETNAIAYRTMHEDMRRPVYKPPPPPPPPPPKKKGLIPAIAEFFFGEL